MRHLSHAELNAVRLKFILAVVSAAIILSLVCLFIWGPLNPALSSDSNIIPTTQSPSFEKKFWIINNLLHNQFTALQQFADVNKQVLQGAQKDESIVTIFQESQNAFKNTIDSVANSVAAADDEEYKREVFATTILFKNELNYFSSFFSSNSSNEVNKNAIANEPNNKQLDLLKKNNQAKDLKIINLQEQINTIKQQNEQSLSSLQQNIKLQDVSISKLQKQLAIAQSKAISGNVNQQVTALQKDIQLKDVKINDLQKQLASNKTNIVTTNATQPNLEALQKNIQAKEAKIASLQKQLDVYSNSNSANIPSSNLSVTEENKFLKWALRSQVAISDNLTKQLNKAKKNNR